MTKKLEEYRKFIFAGIIIISLGVSFSSAVKETLGSFGTVLIAIGGFLFIIGMSKKRKQEEKNNNLPITKVDQNNQAPNE